MASYPLTGTCLCRAVSVTLSEPGNMTVCHCTDCRQFTGSTAAPLIEALRTNVTIKGECKGYSSLADSGTKATRYSCAVCGSSVWDQYRSSDKIEIHAGIFPPHSLPLPKVDIYLRNAESWEVPVAGAQHFQAGDTPSA